MSYSKLQNYIVKLQEAKDKDYGSSFNETWQKYGPVTGLLRLNDKLNRFSRFFYTTDFAVKSESVFDTTIDICNYSIMSAMSLKDENVTFGEMFDLIKHYVPYEVEYSEVIVAFHKLDELYQQYKNDLYDIRNKEILLNSFLDLAKISLLFAYYILQNYEVNVDLDEYC